MTTTRDEFTPAELGAVKRPEPPLQIGRLVVPLAIMVGGYALAGLSGELSLLWGLLIGLVTAGFLLWQKVATNRVHLAAVVLGGSVGVYIFDAILSDRSTVIEKGLSLRASVGWLLFGLVVGVVVSLGKRPALATKSLIARTLATGLAFAGASFLALQAGTAIGFIEPLRTTQIAAGAMQTLTTGFYVQFGAIVAAIGGAAALSLRAGNAVLTAVTGSVVMTLIAVNQVDFSVAEIFKSFGRLGTLAGEFWPPDWAWPRTIGQPEALQIVEPFVETLQIAVVGATIGCIVAVPIAFSASKQTAYNYPVYWVAKAFMNVFRTIPDLFWGILFATSVGFGSPFAGALAMVMFSLSIMAKLLSETVDAIDPGPLEAAKAAGSTHWAMVQYSAYPQVAPNYVAYALYIFELNIRAAVVIGIVGAGGIGRLLNERRNFFQWDQVMAIVIVIFVAVIVIEMFSIWVRKKLV